MTAPRLRIANISKTFGLFQAIKHVSFDVMAGEVIGVTGRSGSGKSVLAMLLAGRHVLTTGDIYLEGKRLQLPQPTRPLGIEVIYQEPVLADGLDITSNIFLGHELGFSLLGRWFKMPSRLRMDEQARQILEELEVQFDSLDEKVTNLSAEQRQLIAIARAMVKPAPVIVIDEVTTLLSYSHKQKLFTLIEQWRQAGSSIIFSSNDLDHLFHVTDRLIVLREGEQVAQYRTDETSREEIVGELLGTAERQQLTPALWALDSFYRSRQQAEKLRHQQVRLERNLAVQGSLNQDLIEQLDAQVKALDKANLALQDANRRLLTEREEERKHLARELHDQLIQDLLGINYQLEAVDDGAQTPEQLHSELLDMRERVGILIDDLRRICGNLRPPTIDSLGLGAALQSYVRDWSLRTGIEVSLDVDPQFGRLSEEIELSIFRIVQESLSNVRKHADAADVAIVIKHTSPRMLMVSIEDNGHGLDEGIDLSVLSQQGHYGLLGISERVALMQGKLRLQNRPEGGLQIRVEIPHPRVERTAAW